MLRVWEARGAQAGTERPCASLGLMGLLSPVSQTGSQGWVAASFQLLEPRVLLVCPPLRGHLLLVSAPT